MPAHAEAQSGGPEAGSNSQAGKGWLERPAKWSFGVLKKMGKGFAKRVGRVMGGLWQSTGGAVLEGGRHAVKSFGPETNRSKEGGPLHMTARFSARIRKAVGGVLSAPVVMVEEGLRGVENIAYGAITGKKIEKPASSTPATTEGEAPDGAHHQAA